MRWLQWPLWSPLRLVLTIVLVVGVAAIIGSLVNRPAEERSPSVASGSAASTPGAIAPTHYAEPEGELPPHERIAESADPEQFAAVTDVATRFMPAWTEADPAARQAALKAVATPRLVDLLAGVPAESVAFSAAGKPEVSRLDETRATVEMPLSNGRRAVLGLVGAGTEWKVETVATSAGPASTSTGQAP